MKARTFSKLASATIVIFACAAIPAFANHGGGGSHGGGGGFHGGGGGGGSYRGGGSSVPRASGNYSRGASSPPAAGAYGRSGGRAYRSYSGPANGGQRSAASSSAPRAVADGHWHSFGGGSSGTAAAGSASEARGSTSTGGSWRVFSGNRSASAGTNSGKTAGTAGTVRSFSGQGGDVWENAPSARNMVSSSQALSSLRGSAAGSSVGMSVASNSSGRPNSSLAASSHLAPGASFGNSLRSNTFTGFGGNSRFGFNGFGGRFEGGFRGGCWKCGIGFGFGLGWGLGFGWPGLYWDDPWWSGYAYPGYGYYGDPSGYIYGDPYAGNYSNSAPPEDYPDADSSVPSASTGSDQNSSRTVGVENSDVPVLLYMKDGSVYTARHYWVADSQLHYVLLSGAEIGINLDQLDVQRTVDVNARSGVKFTLKPGPSSDGTAPKPSPAALPATAPRMNLTSAPPAQT